MTDTARVIDSQAASPNEENVDRALRPTALKEYVGKKPFVNSFISLFKLPNVVASHLTTCCFLDRQG